MLTFTKFVKKTTANEASPSNFYCPFMIAMETVVFRTTKEESIVFLRVLLHNLC